MSTPVITLAHALAEGIPAFRLRAIAKWQERMRPKTARRKDLASKLRSLAYQVEQHHSRQLAA